MTDPSRARALIHERISDAIGERRIEYVGSGADLEECEAHARVNRFTTGGGRRVGEQDDDGEPRG